MNSEVPDLQVVVIAGGRLPGVSWLGLQKCLCKVH